MLLFSAILCVRRLPRPGRGASALNPFLLLSGVHSLISHAVEANRRIYVNIIASFKTKHVYPELVEGLVDYLIKDIESLASRALAILLSRDKEGFPFIPSILDIAACDVFTFSAKSLWESFLDNLASINLRES